MLSAGQYELGTWSVILGHGRPKYLRQRATSVIAGWFVGRPASGIHKRPNFGVIFIANLQFTITTAGRKLKPDWSRSGKP